MLDFLANLNLPLIWGSILAFVIFIYVLLDGFDLGCGILFLFAPSDQCRNKVMNSIAPFWDGNETWLILGAGSLLAAFPVAYSILFSAFYLPIILMLAGLIFRGVAFEFRFKSHNQVQKKFWDISFHGGSVLAAFMQGIILGNFIQGVEVVDKEYAGTALAWVNGFAIFTGVALIFGYALLGAVWINMKTDKETQKWARRAALYIIPYIAIFMFIITLAMPLMYDRIFDLWFVFPNILILLPIPLVSIICFLCLIYSIIKGDEYKPFFLTIALFLFSYIGILISIYPWIIPYKMDIWQASSHHSSQSLMMVGVAIMLPIILTYTGYVYYVFRGKSGEKEMY